MGKVKRGNCFGCDSKDHLAVDCLRKNEPSIAAKIAAAVETLCERNRLRDRKCERNRRGTSSYEDFKDSH